MRTLPFPLMLLPLAVLAAEQDAERNGSGPTAIGESCLDCHPAVVRAYRQTGMARALGPLTDGELAGLNAVAAGDTGFRYHFETDGRAAAIVETWRPPEGAGGEAVRREAPIAFAIGAGILDRAYVAVESERMWFAPLEVLPGKDGGRHAALAPGHAMANDLRFGNRIAPECLACHTDALPPPAFPDNLAPPSEGAGAWVPRGIACAACHGNVARHVAEETGGAPVGGAPFLGLTGSDTVERMSVCARCHLQGDARFPLARDGGPLPPPGGDVLEKLAVFVARAATDDVGFVSQTERLVLSRCYTESQRGGRPMSCESCHDPHHTLYADEERARVRAACSACHSGGVAGEGEPVGSDCAMPRAERGARDCVACHMRVTPVFDVHEVRIHDHFIRTRPGPPSRFEGLRIHATTDGEVRPFEWPGQEPPAFAGDPGLELMALLRVGNTSGAAALADAKPARATRRLPAYNHIHGLVLEGAGRFEEARKAYLRALVLDPGAADSQVNLGLLLGARLGRVEEGLALLDELAARHPLADAAFRNRAVLRALAGDEAGCERDLETAQRLLPNAATARALAGLCEADGRSGRAAEWRAEARRLAPGEP